MGAAPVRPRLRMKLASAGGDTPVIFAIDAFETRRPSSFRISCSRPARHVAALVLVVEPGRHHRLDPERVATTLELTPVEARVAVWLTEGKSVRETGGNFTPPTHAPA